MKKTFKSLLAIAITALAFTACSDVPEPYPTPGTGGGGGDQPEGTIMSANFKTGQSGWTIMDVNHPADFTGAIWTYNSKYGMVATAYADTKNYESESWLVGPSFDLSGTSVASLTIKHAANYFSTSVPVNKACGVMVSTNYVEGALPATATWEELTLSEWPSSFTYITATADMTKFVGNAKVFVAFKYTSTSSKAGTWEIESCTVTNKEAGGNSGGDTFNWGTAEAPISVAQALEQMAGFTDGQTTSVDAYVMGYITSFDEKDAPGNSYGNATYYIADQAGGTPTLEVYRGMGLGGAKIGANDLSVGDKVVVVGKLTLFKSTKEFTQGSKIYSLNGNTSGGGGGDTPTPSGDTDGTEAKPYTVADAIAAGSGTSVFVKAYVVGWIDGKTLSDGAKFNAEATVATNIIIAGTPDETDLSKCMPVQLPSGDIRTAVNLQDHAENYKKEILLVGNIEKYFGATGVKSVSYAKIGDTEAGTKPGGGGGGDTPTPSGNAYLDESFANGKGNFTIEDKVFSGVWTAGSYGSDKYMMATSYIKADGESAKTNHDAESWLISPEINLSTATNPVLTYAQVINKFFGTIADEAMVYAKKEGGEWTKLTITYPATPSSSFSKFTDEGANASVSLANFKSAKTQIAFVYKSSSSAAGTWEIKDIKVAEPAQ